MGHFINCMQKKDQGILRTHLDADRPDAILEFQELKIIRTQKPYKKLSPCPMERELEACASAL